MSRRIREEMLAAGVPAEKVAHIPHGVDTARFHPPSAEERRAARARFGLPAEACVIAYTGRLLRGKGLEDLLAAFARVAAEVPVRTSPDRGLRGRPGPVGGGGPARRGRARDLAARVTFTGRLDDVAAALRAADVFAFPSVYEALGLSLIEAAATGLPAVGARTGGIVDVIEDGASGWLVAPGDVAELAARLRALALDAEARARLGARGRARSPRAASASARALVRYRALLGEVVGRGAAAQLAAR